MLPRINWMREKFCKHPSTKNSMVLNRIEHPQVRATSRSINNVISVMNAIGVESTRKESIYFSLLMTVCCEVKIGIDCLCAIAEV